MALDFYDAYINNLAKTPKEQYTTDIQAMIDRQLTNASTINTIKQETGIGTDVYTDIDVRLTKVFDPLLQQKLGDDYRKITFGQVVSDKLGIRYQFNGNYWISINSDLYNMPTSSVVSVRCNNVLRWIDEDTIEYVEPCHFIFKPTADNYVIRAKVPTIEDESVIICQYNETSDKLKVNDRLIFGKKNVYRITKLNDEIDNNILYITVRIDEAVDGRDDFSSELADNEKPDVSI